MADPTATILSWPALSSAGAGGQPWPALLSYERGVWGKTQGSGADFHWIAATPELTARRAGLSGEFALGSEDAPTRGTLWRTLGDVHYAVSFYPSPSRDAAGRTSFLEKQVFEWRRLPEIPAALGALLLLPAVAATNSEVWWERRSSTPWTGDDTAIDLGSADHTPLPVSLQAMAETTVKGLEHLAGAVPEAALAELYARLLADGRALSLRGLGAPLPPEALAALLLPLPRSKADGLSVAGWLPSLRLADAGGEDLRRCWDLVLGGSVEVPAGPLPAPTPAQAEQGRAMARAVQHRDPAVLAPRPGAGRAPRPEPPARPAPGEPIHLSVWGPTAAGKTVLLAQLYLKLIAKEDQHGDWEIFPGSSLKFVDDMRDKMRSGNLFPTGTAQAERIEYRFGHARSGAEVRLALEDRPGSQYIKAELDDEVKKRLASAAGLVLLFDPLRDPATLEAEIWRTLEHLHVASGRGVQKDDRPIAVCISKADLLIETPADYRRACSQPDEFGREHIAPGLLHLLDRFCSNYRLFPVSAAGVRLHHGVVQPMVFYDETLTLRICPGGDTFNLMAPFAWLLDQVTGAA